MNSFVPSFRRSTVGKRVVARFLLVACVGFLSSPGAFAATLLHHYDFANGVLDLAGDADGVLQGGAVATGGFLTLDGQNDYVQFSTRLVPTEGSWSVAFFAQRDVDQRSHTEVISQGRSSGPGFYIGTDPSGRVRVGDDWAVTPVLFGPVGVLSHYAVTVDSAASVSRLYVNGDLAATLPQEIRVTLNGTNTRLGRQFDPNDEYFDGSVADLRVYEGALPANEVAALAAPVPEPTSWALMFTGGLVLLSVRKRLLSRV